MARPSLKQQLIDELISIGNEKIVINDESCLQSKDYGQFSKMDATSKTKLANITQPD